MGTLLDAYTTLSAVHKHRGSSRKQSVKSCIVGQMFMSTGIFERFAASVFWSRVFFRAISELLVHAICKRLIMLRERHFHIWKRLISVSKHISGEQGPISTSDTRLSRSYSGTTASSSKTSYEHVLTYQGNCAYQSDTGRLKSCKRGSSQPSTVYQQHPKRLLFTSASNLAVTHTAPTNKKTVDLQSKTKRKPSSQNPNIAPRATTNQKVRHLFDWDRLCTVT